MLYGNGITPIDVLSARLRANSGLQGCYSSPQMCLLMQAYQMQHHHHTRPSPQGVVPATSSPSYTPREYSSSPGDCPSEVPISRVTSAASIQPQTTGRSEQGAPSLRRSLPVLQLETLREAQARQSEKVAAKGILGGGRGGHPPVVVDVRETVEFVDMAHRGLGSKRYPSAAMESQDEAPVPSCGSQVGRGGAATSHLAEDTVIMDDDTDGPAGKDLGMSTLIRKEQPHSYSYNPIGSKWGNNSDLLSHNVSAVTFDDTSKHHTEHDDFHHRQDNDTGHYRSDRSFPLVSAIDPTQLAHLQSRYTEDSAGNNEDLSGIDDFPLVSPTERGTPVTLLAHHHHLTGGAVTASALSSLPGGGAFRTGLVASANEGPPPTDVWDGERSPSLAISPETVPSAQHPGHRGTGTRNYFSHVPEQHHHSDDPHHNHGDSSEYEHHRHHDPRLSHLPELELYAPMIDALQQRIREEVSKAVAAERVSELMPPGNTTSQSYVTDMADYQRLRESMAGELYGLKRQIQLLLKAPIGMTGHSGSAGLPTYPATYEFPGRGGGGKGEPPLVRRSSSLHGDHLSLSHSQQRKSVKPLRESKLGLSGSIDVSLRRSSNYNMVRSGSVAASPSNHTTPVRREKKKIVVKVVKGYDSPPVPYTKRRVHTPSPKRPSPDSSPVRAGGGFSKRPAVEGSPSSPLRGKLRRSSASDLRHSLSDYGTTPGPRARSYSQSTFMEESVADISD